MELKTKTVELRIITASENMVLTNGEVFSEVGGDVYLGCNDSPDNWYEITAEEAEELQKEQEGEIEDVLPE